jgi:hypothetical protein
MKVAFKIAAAMILGIFIDKKTLTGILLDEQSELSMQELCRVCRTSADWVLELVE